MKNANLTYGILRFFQCFQKYFGFGWSDDGGEFLFRCFADALHALEVFQEGGLCLFANAFDGVEGGGSLSLATLVAMEGDGEAVHFVLYLLQ